MQGRRQPAFLNVRKGVPDARDNLDPNHGVAHGTEAPEGLGDRQVVSLVLRAPDDQRGDLDICPVRTRIEVGDP